MGKRGSIAASTTMSAHGWPTVVSLWPQTGHLPISWALADEWRHACYTMFLCCFNLQVLEVRVELYNQLWCSQVA